jgi:hypothetical protein
MKNLFAKAGMNIIDRPISTAFKTIDVRKGETFNLKKTEDPFNRVSLISSTAGGERRKILSRNSISGAISNPMDDQQADHKKQIEITRLSNEINWTSNMSNASSKLSSTYYSPSNY